VNWVNQLQASPLVEIAEPNFLYKANRIPNDPELQKLWGLRNEGQEDSGRRRGIIGVDIGAEQAWDIETGSHNVVVAVIDSGVDYNHTDLKANTWTNNPEFFGMKGVDDDKNGYIDDIYGYDFAGKDADPMDENGHGTHVSGTIGASGNDGAGIVGVNWKVRIMSLRFLDAEGSGSLADAIEAIKYATKMNANVMSNSWGSAGYSKLMHNAIKEANKKQILFVAAAGNHSKNNDENKYYPANFESPNVIAVAAVDNLGALASFSGFGIKTVHIAAPGVNVFSSTPKGYDSWSGTSMATPHVSGVAALVLAREPKLTAQQLRDRLIRTASPLRSIKDKVIAKGIVNAHSAILDQKAPFDKNDPAFWTQSKPLNIATAQPYLDSTHQVWEVNIEGAQDMALYFSKFDTETRFDEVSFYNRKGQAIDAISGPIGPHWSAVIPGDFVRIVFHSDMSNTAQGFEITKVSYR
jgi:subtilisin family serine protease